MASQTTTITQRDVVGNSFHTLNYEYDPRGLIVEKNDSSEGVLELDYDALARLVSVTHPLLGLTTFVLDALDNRTQTVAAAGTEDYAVNDLNQYTQAGDETFDYDANGNLIERSETESGVTTGYVYDAKDRLVGVGLEAEGDLSFQYDVFGHRVEKTVGTQSVRYLWDGNEVLAELDQDGNLLRSYVHGIEVDEILYQEDYGSGETVFFHGDQLVSTLALTDASGQLKESYAYDVYGNLVSAEDSAGAAITEFATRYLYTGRELDAETGLYYNRARYYDPELGRFLTTDPKGYAAGLNLYNYVRSNPLTFRDPQGLDVYWGRQRVWKK